MLPQVTLKAGRTGKAAPMHAAPVITTKRRRVDNLVEFLEAAKKNDMPRPFTVHQRSMPPE